MLHSEPLEDYLLSSFEWDLFEKFLELHKTPIYTPAEDQPETSSILLSMSQSLEVAACALEFVAQLLKKELDCSEKAKVEVCRDAPGTRCLLNGPSGIRGALKVVVASTIRCWMTHGRMVLDQNSAPSVEEQRYCGSAQRCLDSLGMILSYVACIYRHEETVDIKTCAEFIKEIAMDEMARDKEDLYFDKISKCELTKTEINQAMVLSLPDDVITGNLQKKLGQMMEFPKDLLSLL